jgi:predicted nucleic acid-binding protein
MIAGHALAEQAVLVAHNVLHFERVAGLRVESWMVSG